MLNHRIPVDFNTMNSDVMERIYINTHVHSETLTFLTPLMRVVLYDEEFEVEATIEFDQIHGKWYGIPVWSTRRDFS